MLMLGRRARETRTQEANINLASESLGSSTPRDPALLAVFPAILFICILVDENELSARLLRSVSLQGWKATTFTSQMPTEVEL